VAAVSFPEEELARGGDVVIGATVGTFDQLFGLVARATDAPAGPAVSRTQRLRLAREAASRAELRILATSSRRPGFPAALEELVSELQAALVDPLALRERAGEAGAYELEIASLYESYLKVRDGLVLHDDHCGGAPRFGARDRSSSTASTI
jgi:ATP-dependent helicase/DNAse subunit B